MVEENWSFKCETGLLYFLLQTYCIPKSQEKYETLQRDNEKLRLEIEETKTNHIRSNESLAPSSGLGSEDDEQENTAREFFFNFLIICCREQY